MGRVDYTKNANKKWGTKMEELATMVERAQLEKIQWSKKKKNAKMGKKKYMEAEREGSGIVADQSGRGVQLDNSPITHKRKINKNPSKNKKEEQRTNKSKGFSTSCPTYTPGFSSSNRGRSISFTGGPNFSYAQYDYTYTHEDNTNKSTYEAEMTCLSISTHDNDTRKISQYLESFQPAASDSSDDETSSSIETDDEDLLESALDKYAQKEDMFQNEVLGEDEDEDSEESVDSSEEDNDEEMHSVHATHTHPSLDHMATMSFGHLEHEPAYSPPRSQHQQCGESESSEDEASVDFNRFRKEGNNFKRGSPSPSNRKQTRATDGGPRSWPKDNNMGNAKRQARENNNSTRTHKPRDKKVRFKSKYAKYYTSYTDTATHARGWVVGGTVKEDTLLQKNSDGNPIKANSAISLDSTILENQTEQEMNNNQKRKNKPNRPLNEKHSQRGPVDMLEVVKLVEEYNNFVNDWLKHSIEFFPKDKQTRILIYSLAVLYKLKKSNIAEGRNRSIVLKKSKKTAPPSKEQLSYFLLSCIGPHDAIPANKEGEESGTRSREEIAARCISKTMHQTPTEFELLRRGGVPARYVGENACPVGEENIGNKMLRGMGWAGGSLGVGGKGIIEPIPQKIKTSRSGLG